MTTFEAAAGLLHRATGNLQARAARKAQRRAVAKTAATAVAGLRSAVLQIAGLAFFTTAAWSFDYRLGLAVAGVCSIYLAQALSDG